MISVRNLLPRSNGSRILIIFFLAGMLGVSSCSKKVFRTRRDRDRDVPKEKKEEEKKTPIDEDSRGRAASVISLMLPFHLDKVDPASAGSLSDFGESDIALDFYQGFRMALDSLAEAGAKFRLQVYDTKDNEAVVNQLQLKDEVRGSNLIVGPVYPAEAAIISNYAKNNQVYFVSPLAPRVIGKNNPYQIVATAPLEMHTARGVDFIRERFPGARVLLINSIDEHETPYIKNFLQEASRKGLKVEEVNVGRFGDAIAGMKKYLSDDRQYVLVVPSANPTFWKVLFSYLDMSASGKRIAILAHPNFVRMEGTSGVNLVKAEKYQTYFTAAGAIASSKKGNGFYEAYKHRYKMEPSEYAAKGFDLGIFLGAALWNSGNNLDEVLTKEHTGYQNNFNFIKTPDGYINQGVKVLKVENYQYIEQ